MEQTIIADALDNLRVHQRQLDMDGTEVGVSRQALNEAISYIGRLTADRDFWKERLQVETRARIEAEALSRTGAVKVKALAWSDHPAGGEQALGAGLGLYRVHANGDDWYLVPDHMGNGGKAAAQADFDKRIRSALASAEPVPAKGGER